jgi:hypothetical protein
VARYCFSLGVFGFIATTISNHSIPQILSKNGFLAVYVDVESVAVHDDAAYKNGTPMDSES